MRPSVSFLSRLAASAFCLSLFLTNPGLAQPAPGSMGGARGPTAVGVITLEQADVPFTTTLPGRATAHEEVPIRPRVAGVISEVAYEAGRAVKKGDLLFRIDGDTYQAELAAAQAEVDRAAAALTTAEANLKRYERLEGTGVTTADLDDVRVAVFQNKADLSSAEAALTLARLNLERTEIRSPIDGIAETAEVSVGAVVTANQSDELTNVTTINPIFVDAEESSKRIAEVRQMIDTGLMARGEKINFSLWLENGQRHDAIGTLVAPGTRVSSTTGTTQIRIQFDNPDRRILPGQFLRVEIELGTTRAILVPQGATSRAADGTLTAFIATDGKAELRSLTEAGAFENKWIVTSGATAGETLIVDGLSNLRAGAEIAPTPVTIAPNGVVTDLPAANNAEAKE